MTNDLEKNLEETGLPPEDAKKLADDFVAGLKEVGFTDNLPPTTDSLQAPAFVEASLSSKTSTTSALIKLGVNSQTASKYSSYLDAAMSEFSINTSKRKAMFVAQVLHESARLAYVSENLNYSAGGLVRVFKKYFNTNTAASYARNPKKIACCVYANRMGNGNEASGDGWTFRGRGGIQLTGKANYLDCGKGLKVDLIKKPEYLETPEGAMRSAAWYWSTHGLNAIADAGDINGSTKRINGGFNGLDDRIALYRTALRLF